MDKIGSIGMGARRMIHTVACILILMTCAVSAETVSPADFYVSVSGSDSWSGRQTAPSSLNRGPEEKELARIAEVGLLSA